MAAGENRGGRAGAIREAFIAGNFVYIKALGSVYLALFREIYYFEYRVTDCDDDWNFDDKRKDMIRGTTHGNWTRKPHKTLVRIITNWTRNEKPKI